MAYIYKIENLINGKKYIGKTELPDPQDRWYEHKKAATRQHEQTRALYRALNKYGIDNFLFEVIESDVSVEELANREIFWIDYYNSYHEGYNETLGGDGCSYLCLPEDEICKYYLQRKSIHATADYFGHDFLTIKKVLIKNGIHFYTPQEIQKLTACKAVMQLDKETEEIIKVFPSIQAAENATGNSKHISQVCNGKRKSAAGYKWKYVEPNN